MNRHLPNSAGIGLRAPHVSHVLAAHPSVPWFEVHSENYFADGGPALAALDRIRADYPVSLHGVGLSLGSTDALDTAHLAKLSRLVDRIDPAQVSEHLCWSSVNGRHFNDLLPLPYTREALDHVCARVSAVQDCLWPRNSGRKRVQLPDVSGIHDDGIEFVVEVAVRSGCGLLVDVNNIYVNARNRARRRRLPGGDSPRAGGGDPFSRLRRERPLPHRHAWRPGRAGVWALYERRCGRLAACLR
jgi:uncharacterized protein (UPF0276 family)